MGVPPIVGMVCHACEESARQWGYYMAVDEEEQESCPLCGSDDVSIRRDEAVRAQFGRPEASEPDPSPSTTGATTTEGSE